MKYIHYTISVLCTVFFAVNTVAQNPGDTAMLEYPVLVFDIQNQNRLFLQDPSGRTAMKSYSPNYLAVKVDEMAKEIVIGPSKNGKDVFYDPYTNWLYAYVKRIYADEGYKFYWIDSHQVQRRLRVVVEEKFIPDTPEETSASEEKLLTRNEFNFFMRRLTYSPDVYYPRFLWKDSVPVFNGEYPEMEDRELSMEDYYAIFQKGYPYTYPRAHPFYFLSYKKQEHYTQFFIYHYIEAWGNSIYLIHLNDSGKKVFETVIWNGCGDGGNYARTENSCVTENMAGCINEEGYLDENPYNPVYRKTTERKFYFDPYGNLIKREETETLEGAYPFETYDPVEWFPEK